MRIAIIVIAILFSVNGFAQDRKSTTPRVANDTVYHQGKPYCLLKEFKMNARFPDYSVRSISNNELIYLKFIDINTKDSSGYYRFTFKKSGKQVQTSVAKAAYIPEILVNSELISNGVKVDSLKEENFIANNSSGVIVNGVNNKYALVNRDKSMPIVVLNSDIMQQVAKIGSFQESGTYIDKVFTKQVIVYLPNGTKIAEAKYAEKGSNAATILTHKDGVQHNITVNPTKNIRRQVFEWLVSKNYL